MSKWYIQAGVLYKTGCYKLPVYVIVIITGRGRYMEDTKIQWHPGFVAAMEMEFKEDRKNLEFESEHNLNRKPLEVDLLVINKEPSARLHNEIGKPFRGHNLMEYKSPSDSLDIDTFYKVTGYACLYKSYGKTTDGIKAGDVTISLVRETKPEKLFKYFNDNNVEVTMPYKGIYYISGMSMFPAQVIVTSELEQESHIWIKALTDKMEKAGMEKLIEKSVMLSDVYDKMLVESILEVTLNANSSLIEELRGDAKMGEMILKVVQPLILEREKKAENRGIEKGKILGAVEILRNFNSNEEIKTIIMEKYHLTESDAEKYLQ